MARRPRPCSSTLNLFETWVPPVVVKTFEPVAVRAATLRSSISKAVSLSLKEGGKGREETAREIGEYLGEDCPKNMLDAYASESREEHSISLLRFIGLVAVTRDMRLLNLVANLFGWVVVDQKYLPAIREAICTDKIEELQQIQKQARRDWRGF